MTAIHTCDETIFLPLSCHFVFCWISEIDFHQIIVEKLLKAHTITNLTLQLTKGDVAVVVVLVVFPNLYIVARQEINILLTGQCSNKWL